MRHPVTFVLTLLISLQLATAAIADWVVERTSSSVWASADGQNWRDVRVGETFSGETWIQTGERGQVIFARDVERIVYRPGTIATLKTQANTTNVGAIRGSVLLSIDPNRGGQTIVKTPHLAAVVLGTVLEVSTNGAQSSVRVDVGRVQVEHGGRRATLEKGQQGVVQANATQRITIEAARVTSVAPSGAGFSLATGTPTVVAQEVINTVNERLRASSSNGSTTETGRRNNRNVDNDRSSNRNAGGNDNAGNNGNGNGNAGNNGNGNGNAGNNGNGNGNAGNNGNGNGNAGNNGNGNGNAGNNGNGNGNAGNNGNGNGNAGNNGNGRGNRDDDDDDDDDD